MPDRSEEKPDYGLPEAERQYVHHSYVWLGSLRTVFFILVAAAFSFASAFIGPLLESSDDVQAMLELEEALLTIGAALLITIIIVVVYQIVSYKYIYYSLQPKEFDFYQGILNKKRVHIPYQRIQSVDQRATLVQRLFGVCSVSIDTAGGAANKAVIVPYLTKQQAESLRTELFARKTYLAAEQAGKVPAGSMPVWRPNLQPGDHAEGNILDAPASLWDDIGGVFAGDAVNTGTVTYEYGLSNKELIFTGLSNNSAFALAVFAVLGAFAQILDMLLQLIPDSQAILMDNITMVAEEGTWMTAIAITIGIVVGLAVIVWLASAIGTCINYGGFHARRRNNRIEVEHGLLQHQFQGVDIDRVQSIVIRQSFIRRIIGYCEIVLGKVDAAVSSDEASSSGRSSVAIRGMVIHPFVKIDRVPEILHGIIPEFSDVPHETIPVAKVALRRALIRRCILQGSGFWLAISIGIAQILVNLILPLEDAQAAAYLPMMNMIAYAGYVICLLLAALDAIGAVLWFRGSSFAYNRRYMQVSNSGFARETVSFPRNKIQYAYTRTNPFQRRARTATVTVRIAAGVGGTTLRLIDAQDEDADVWLRWIQPYGSVVQ